MATIALNERSISGHPEEIKNMPCFRCNAKMLPTEFKVPVYKKNKFGTTKRLKTKYAFVCKKCGAETSLFDNWTPVFKTRRELKKYYDDVKSSSKEARKIINK